MNCYFARSLLPSLACVLALATTAQAGTDCGEDHSIIRLNQVGFQDRAAKWAILVSASDQPVSWRLESAAGELLADGETLVFGPDAASGQHVHQVNFSDFAGHGESLRLAADCAASHPFTIGEHPWGNLYRDALAYFYRDRSGVPIEALAAGDAWARPAGHPHDVATCISGKDPQGNEWPGCDYRLDATGGWYDAGDHGKYVVNGGIAVWTLLNLYERQQVLGKPPAFPDGSTALPEAGNGVNDLLDEARFELEFLLRMQAPEGAAATVPVGIPKSRPGMPFRRIDASGMAHHKIADRHWTELPTPPQEDKQPRVLHAVSTAATLNLAATAAQCARIWNTIDAEFSGRCLVAAERAWAAAVRNPEVYFIARFEGSGMYGDDDLSDEFFWAASELYATTGRDTYLDALRDSPHYRQDIESEPAWPRVAALGVMTLALHPGDLQPDEAARLRQRLVDAGRRFASERDRSGYHIPFATTEYRWGSNSNLLNRAMVLAYAHDFSRDEALRNAAIDAWDYLLGRNALDQSYVSGYGARSFSNPHHRNWAPSFDSGLPPPPPGVLSGGPNSTNPADPVAKEIIGDCAPQTCWRDDVRAYSMNEVAINWNAPLVWIAAWLREPVD